MSNFVEVSYGDRIKEMNLLDETSEEVIRIVCECSNSSVDWSQFWPSMIATFVGFALALLGEFAFEKIKSLVDSTALLKRVRQELCDVEIFLKSWKTDLIERHPLKTLVWDEAINVGQVSLLNTNKRELLFKIYKQIQEFNSWSEVQTNYYFEHEGKLNDILSQELLEEKEFMLGTKNEDGKIDINSVLSII